MIRAVLFRILLPSLLLWLASCAACPTDAQVRVLHPSFHSPEQAGLSFLAAMGCDQAQAEYLCLAESLKEETGATLDGWLLARQNIRQEVGVLLRAASRLRPLASETWQDGVVVWWSEDKIPRFGLKMVPQHYFDLYVQGGRKVGAFLPSSPGELLHKEGSSLHLEIQDPVLRHLSPADVHRFELATEWKIAGFVPVAPEP